MKPPILEDEINKRLTLNWLIQGAAQHASLTFHHLVRDELNAIEPAFLPLNDRFALLMLVQHWRGMATIFHGPPTRFWKRAKSNPGHPFYNHPLLSKYGGPLAEAEKKRTFQRCKEKGATCLPVVFSFQAVSHLTRLRKLESPHRLQLERLAIECASKVWDIPAERLDAQLVDRVVPEQIIPIHSFRDAIDSGTMVGYGGIMRRKGELRVVAKAMIWQALTHELVKGTAELICLHGLNRLNDDVYQRVIGATDRLGFEPWMLQTGGELWRRFLAAIPDGQSLPQVLMDLALSPAQAVESRIAAVIEQPPRPVLVGQGQQSNF